MLAAGGRDARGGGTAQATVTGTLTPADSGPGTTVTVVTELAITGRPAQFGRGMIGHVSGKLIGQFASCLEAKLRDEGPAPAASAGSAPPAAAAAVADEPVADEPVADEPVADEPVADEPVVDEPVAPAGPTPAVAPGPVPAEAGPGPVQPAQPVDPTEPIDLLAVTGVSGAVKRAAPYVIGFVIAGLIVWGLLTWLA